MTNEEKEYYPRALGRAMTKALEDADFLKGVIPDDFKITSKPVTFEMIQEAATKAIQPREPAKQIMSPQSYVFALKVEELEKKLKIAMDALKIIASVHSQRKSTEEYWMARKKEQCALVLATDTKIARNALKESEVTDDEI